MSIAQSFTSNINLQKLCTNNSPCRTSSSASMNPRLLRTICTSNRRYQSVIMHSKGPNMDPKSSIPLKDSSESPLSFKAPNWLKWTLGSIVWLSFSSWKKFQGVKEVVNKVESVVEIIETVAEVTEEISSDISEQLPDGGGMKNVVLKLEQASEEVVKDVQAIDDFIDKVEEQVEGLKKLNESKQAVQGEGAKKLGTL